MPKTQQIPIIIDYVETTSKFTKSLIEKISSPEMKISSNFLTILNHELRTPLTPIRSYAEMLLNGHYGELSEMQKNRIEMIMTNAVILQQKIESHLDKQNFETISNEKNISDHQIKELKQEKLLLKKINSLLEEKNKKK